MCNRMETDFQIKEMVICWYVSILGFGRFESRISWHRVLCLTPTYTKRSLRCNLDDSTRWSSMMGLMKGNFWRGLGFVHTRIAAYHQPFDCIFIDGLVQEILESIQARSLVLLANLFQVLDVPKLPIAAFNTAPEMIFSNFITIVYIACAGFGLPCSFVSFVCILSWPCSWTM